MDKYLKEALSEYERKIESGEPFYMDASILMDIEEYYEKNERPYDAERIMRFAEKLHPHDEEVKIVKAYRLKAIGKWSEALNIIRGLSNPDQRDAHLFIIEYEVASGRINEAEKRFRTCLAQAVDMPKEERDDWMIEMAEILLDYGFINRAIDTLRQVGQGQAAKHRLYELLGDAYYQLHDYGNSIKAFQELVDSSPYDSISWGQLADALQKANRLDDCLTACDYALAIDDSNTRAMNLKLFALWGLGRHDEAYSLYHSYAQKMPEDYAIKMYAGEQLNNRGKYIEALPVLQDALRLCMIENPDRNRIIQALAIAEMHTGNSGVVADLAELSVITGNTLIDSYLEVAESLTTNDPKLSVDNLLHKAFKSKDEHSEGQLPNIIKIIRFLCTHNLYLQQRSLWEEIARKSYPDSCADVYAYITYAMYMIRNRLLFLINMNQAAQKCPQTLFEIMKETLQAKSLDDVLTNGRSTANGWQESTGPLEQ